MLIYSRCFSELAVKAREDAIGTPPYWPPFCSTKLTHSLNEWAILCLLSINLSKNFPSFQCKVSWIKIIDYANQGTVDNLSLDFYVFFNDPLANNTENSNLYFIYFSRKWIISNNKFCQAAQCATSKISSFTLLLNPPHRSR